MVNLKLKASMPKKFTKYIFVLLPFIFLSLYLYNHPNINIDSDKHVETVNTDKTKYIVLEESGSPEYSDSDKWWLNSGGIVFISQDNYKTNFGKVSFEKWLNAYKNNNPLDTDNGQHPQNIFRLVSRDIYLNSRQTATFVVNAVNTSNSKNRNASNGFLFFSRYIDGDNLYYAGLRVDGFSVIKKKTKGKHTTLSYNKVFEGKYDRDTNPNLIPINKPLSMMLTTISEGGATLLRLYVKDDESKDSWTLIAEAKDNAILKGGSYGIRSDFMDLEIKNYKTEELNFNALSN